MWASVLGTPARLVITVSVIRQAAQVRAIDADNVNLAAVIIAKVVEVSREYHPFAIRRKGGTLTIAAARRKLARIRAIGVHNIDFAMPGSA